MSATMHADERALVISQARAMRRHLLRLQETGEPLHLPGVSIEDAIRRLDTLISKQEAAR